MRLRGGAGKSALCSSATSALKAKAATIKDEDPIVSIACVGAGRSAPPVVSKALEAQAGSASVVSAPKPLVLLGAASASDADRTAAIAAADVIALDVHFDDLVGSTAHGLSQLLPELQRAVLLRDLHPQPKLLLLAISDYDASEASEDDVRSFVNAQLQELVASLALPEDLSGLAAAELLQAQCFFIPREKASAEAYSAALSSLRTALIEDSSPAYLFKDSFSTPASSFVSCIGQAADRAPGAAPSAMPVEAYVTYQCSLFAEVAAREFQQGAAELRKAADSELLADFGDKAGELISQALAHFDVDSAAFKDAAPAVAARAALAEQLQRALYGTYRKQLALLQRITLSKFVNKIPAFKGIDVEDKLKVLLKQATAAFDASAKLLLAPDVRWTYDYEQASVVKSMKEAALAQVQQLQMQGLYIAKTGKGIPVDISAHWLLQHPFGRDLRYDPIETSDTTQWMPTAEDFVGNPDEAETLNLKWKPFGARNKEVEDYNPQDLFFNEPISQDNR